MSAQPKPSRAPLRRTRGDLIATGVISTVSVLAVLGAWATAPIRQSELIPAAEEYSASAQMLSVPDALAPSWTIPDSSPAGATRPVLVDGLLITSTTTEKGDSLLRAVNPAGEEIWSYRRDLELCALSTAWGKVVATYRSNLGCGDVVSIDANTGQYDKTRSAIGGEEVVAIASNDRVGTVSSQGVDLWRSDMVRTVFYGTVEGVQEPDLQPNPGCTISSALTRTEHLAVTESCPEDENTWLRIQKATPESSREPEVTKDIAFTHSGARLVAIGQSAVAVYHPLETPAIISYDFDGNELSRTNVSLSPLLAASIVEPEGLFAPIVGDLPHHMSWFDGERLYLFNPSDLSVTSVIEGAIGTGITIADSLLVPTTEGIAVLEDNVVIRTIAVERSGYNGPAMLGVLGPLIVEKRAENTVGLQP